MHILYCYQTRIEVLLQSSEDSSLVCQSLRVQPYDYLPCFRHNEALTQEVEALICSEYSRLVRHGQAEIFEFFADQRPCLLQSLLVVAQREEVVVITNITVA